MKTSVISASELDEAACARWRALQAANPALASPCFAPEFTLAVAAARPDLRVAVLEDAGAVAGFLPFHARWGLGGPVAGGLSDHHGLVCAPQARWDWPAVLRGAGLATWRFDHLPRSQAPAGARPAESPGLDLSRGFAAWRQGRLDAGHRLRELDRKARRMARELGPLRFEPHLRDRAVLETVLQLKSRQCRRTGVPDLLARAWRPDLVERVWQAQAPGFAGRLSGLYAGDTLVAAHLGMCGERVWHWWLPVYLHEHARHSPGLLLLMEVARAAAGAGMDLLDLGKGEDAYKRSFADTARPLAEGCVAFHPALTRLRSAVSGTVPWLKSLPPARALRPLVRRWRLRQAGPAHWS